MRIRIRIRIRIIELKAKMHLRPDSTALADLKIESSICCGTLNINQKMAVYTPHCSANRKEVVVGSSFFRNEIVPNPNRNLDSTGQMVGA